MALIIRQYSPFVLCYVCMLFFFFGSSNRALRDSVFMLLKTLVGTMSYFSSVCWRNIIGMLVLLFMCQYITWVHSLMKQSSNQSVIVEIPTSSTFFFLEKGNFIDFKSNTSRWYIVLKFSRPLPNRYVHNLKRVCSWHIRPYTLMTINSKTRPPPRCPVKKILGHLLQEMRCRYKLVLQCMSLKDSPRTEPVCSQVQKGRSFVIKHHSVSASPNRPTQDCRA